MDNVAPVLRLDRTLELVDLYFAAIALILKGQTVPHRSEPHLIPRFPQIGALAIGMR